MDSENGHTGLTERSLTVCQNSLWKGEEMLVLFTVFFWIMKILWGVVKDTLRAVKNSLLVVKIGLHVFVKGLQEKSRGRDNFFPCFENVGKISHFLLSFKG